MLRVRVKPKPEHKPTGGGVEAGQLETPSRPFWHFFLRAASRPSLEPHPSLKPHPACRMPFFFGNIVFLWFSTDSLFPATQLKTQPLILRSPGWPGASAPPNIKLPPSLKPRPCLKPPPTGTVQSDKSKISKMARNVTLNSKKVNSDGRIDNQIPLFL